MRIQQNYAVLSLVLVGLVVGLIYLAADRPETQTASQCDPVEVSNHVKRLNPPGYKPDDIELNNLINEMADKSGDCLHQSVFDASMRNNTRRTTQ